MSDFYNVVFSGQISAGADAAAVRANIARLFKVNDAMLDKLFSGQRIAVKKACDQATAMKLRASMKQAGAVAQMEPCDAQGKPLAAVKAGAPAPNAAAAAPVTAPKPAAPVQPAAVPPPQAVPAKAPTMAERIAALAAQHAQQEALKPDPDAPPKPADVQRVETWKMFPTGFLLGEVPRDAGRAPLAFDLSRYTISRLGTELMQPEERAMLAPKPVVVPDLSAIKVAPPGAPVLRDEEKVVAPPVVVDISAMTMAPPNTEVLKENEKRVVVPVEVDISSLSMAPPGTDLEEIRVEKKLVNPDTSGLSVAPM
jgi:hypothetical protein